MSDCIIARRGGSGGGGSMLPYDGALLEVVTFSMGNHPGFYDEVESVSVTGDELSLSITADKDKMNDYKERDGKTVLKVLRDPEYGRFAFLFPIPASWYAHEWAREGDDKFYVTVTVNAPRGKPASSRRLFIAGYYLNGIDGGGEWGPPHGRCWLFPSKLAPFSMALDSFFGLNPSYEIVNRNSYSLEEVYNESGKRILKGPSGGSVNTDLITGEDGSFSITIPGDTFSSLTVAGHANGTTGKVYLYDNNGTARTQINLTSSQAEYTRSIPGSTGPLRLNIVGKDLYITKIKFDE